MNVGRGIFVHLGLLALAAASATYVWTREEPPKALAQAQATIWSGSPEDVQKVVFEGKSKKVVLVAKEDKAGTFYVGSLEREAAPPSPHAPPDANAPPPSPGGRTKTDFVGVGTADKLIKSLAPLRALRAIGRIPEERLEEFGLKDPEGTLAVTIGGTEHKLVIGGTTPGGGDRYVRDAARGEGYVIDGEAVRDLDTADSRLIERDLHEWKEPEATAATVSAEGKTRQLVRSGPDGKRFWADPAAADQKDETAGNCMDKISRLRPSDYVMTDPAGKQDIMRVEYSAGSRPLGWIELVRVPAADPSGKPDYLVRTERTRFFAKVPAASAEQVEQDLKSVVK